MASNRRPFLTFINYVVTELDSCFLNQKFIPHSHGTLHLVCVLHLISFNLSISHLSSHHLIFVTWGLDPKTDRMAPGFLCHHQWSHVKSTCAFRHHLSGLDMGLDRTKPHKFCSIATVCGKKRKRLKVIEIFMRTRRLTHWAQEKFQNINIDVENNVTIFSSAIGWGHHVRSPPNLQPSKDESSASLGHFGDIVPSFWKKSLFWLKAMIHIFTLFTIG